MHVTTENQTASEAQPPPPQPIVEAVPPLYPTPPAEIVAALRAVEGLNGLTDQEYLWLASHCAERAASESAIVFHVNEHAHHMNIILRGEILVHRSNSASITSYIGRAAQITGKLPYSRMKTWAGEGCSSGPVWVLDIHEDCFPAMLKAIPSMGQRCVSILLDRVRDFTRADQQAEKLVALGKLAANLSHELKNPASAARGASLSLASRIEHEQDLCRLGRIFSSDEELARFTTWAQKTLEHISSTSADLDPLSESDREENLTRWLEANHVAGAWAIAPAFAGASLPIASLEDLAALIGPDVLGPALRSFASSLDARSLIGAISDSSARIFHIIDAIKDYTYMDQAPIQEIDLARSLDSTLALLNQRLQGIVVTRDYDPALPFITGYGAELSLVWTALVENAIDALGATGSLRISTHKKGGMAFIEVWDDGSGIEPVILSRIFEPFFTTKPLGQGLGLGLDLVRRIVNKHFGSVDVQSSPHSTCFQVRLPLGRPTMF